MKNYVQIRTIIKYKCMTSLNQHLMKILFIKKYQCISQSLLFTTLNAQKNFNQKSKLGKLRTNREDESYIVKTG